MPKIHFTGRIPVEHEKIIQNRENTKKLNLPRVELGCSKRDGRLAVVGGGPSVSHYIEQIRQYPEVWAVNGACAFLRGHGIDSWLFAVDPHHIVTKWAPGASKALLCDRVDPEVFEILKGADIRIFTVAGDEPGWIMSGSSTATIAFQLGIEQGFEFVDFYGCESSFENGSHAYQDENREHLLWVECNGREYKTAPDFYLQAQEMAALIRSFRNNFKHYGGGLLEAMIEDPEHDITHVSRAMMDELKPICP